MMGDAAPLLAPGAVERGLERVSPGRREKILRLRRREDRARSLGAGLLLRQALADAGLAPDSLTWTTGAHGKPELWEIRREFQFNLSHSGRWVLCLAEFSPQGAARPLGCDVEQMGEADLRLAERFFSPEENRGLRALPQEERRDRFYRLWTLKESFLKATGAGLTGGLDSFTVGVGEREITLTDREGRPLPYRLGEARAGPGYKAAWCVALGAEDPQWQRWTLREDGAFPEEEQPGGVLPGMDFKKGGNEG